MAKTKKPAKNTEPAAESADPHAVLRHPANPPRPRLAAFLFALAAFFAWFAYVVYVAMSG